MNESLQVPVTARVGDNETDALIDVEAAYCEHRPATRYEPEEPGGYEIFTARLQVDANLRAICTDRLWLRVQGGGEVAVDMEPALVAKADAIDLDDEDLREELTVYLNSK